MILIEENFLNNKTCDEIVKFSDDLKANKFRPFRDIYVQEIFNINPKASSQIGMFYSTYLSFRGLQIYPELMQITVWPTGSKQKTHVDSARESTVLTSITYLNDDYEGGETYFENGITISPKKGKTVFFDGIKYPHGVNTVKNNKRRILAIWYSNNIQNLYI